VKPELTAERLRELLRYDPATGEFRWLQRVGNRSAGSKAGGASGGGYWSLCVDYRLYSAHRLAWLYTHGIWPKDEIDHRDGNRANNAIANLRDVSRSVNMQNQKRAKRGSQSGVLGVYWSKQGRKWVAQIRVDRKLRHIGRFDSAETAHAAYIEAKRALHPGSLL
jgi:hypothetical protein